jgi:hypothetical protein
MKWRAVGFAAFVSVVLAAILLAGSVESHRARVSLGWPDDTRWVLVAKQRIPKGTPGSFVFSQSMYATTPHRRKELEGGAICSPTYLNGRVSAVDIFPGEQLTETDFTASDVGDRGRGC